MLFDYLLLTASTVIDTLRQTVRTLRPALLASAIWLVLLGLRLSASAPDPGLDWLIWALVAALLLGSLGLLWFNGRHAYAQFRRVFGGRPPAPALQDMGKALLAGLRDAGLVGSQLSEELVEVRPVDRDRYEVFVEQASPEESGVFAQAYSQIFDTPPEPRYWVSRDLTELPDRGWQPVWALIRLAVFRRLRLGIVYHPVPDCLAANKQKAEAFAAQWRQYVGGGELVYSRSAAGTQALTHVRNQPLSHVRQMVFEIWH